MPVFKDNLRGTWYVMARYTAYNGEHKQKCKRGFVTKREALAWEREFLLADSGNLIMLFKTFAEEYLNEMKPRLKLNTFLTKKSNYISAD